MDTVEIWDAASGEPVEVVTYPDVDTGDPDWEDNAFRWKPGMRLVCVHDERGYVKRVDRVWIGGPEMRSHP